MRTCVKIRNAFIAFELAKVFWLQGTSRTFPDNGTQSTGLRCRAGNIPGYARSEMHLSWELAAKSGEIQKPRFAKRQTTFIRSEVKIKNNVLYYDRERTVVYSFFFVRSARAPHRDGKFKKIRKPNAPGCLSDAIKFSLPRAALPTTHFYSGLREALLRYFVAARAKKSQKMHEFFSRDSATFRGQMIAVGIPCDT